MFGKGSFSYGYTEENPDQFVAVPGDIVLCGSGNTLYRRALEPVSLCMIKFVTEQPVPHSGMPIRVPDHARLAYNLKALENIHFIVDPAPGRATEHYCRDIIYQALLAVDAQVHPLNAQYLHINSHFCETLSVEALAASAGFSIVHFINLFRSEYGRTPKQYITDLRIKKALFLLRNTGLGITDVAALCGYADALYLSRIFKKYTGISPAKARSK